MINLNNLLTEKRNPYTLNIDNVSTLEMCMLLNEEDKRVAIAIRNVLPQIAMAIDEITSHLKDGGRLFYIGAGTSGRLGILDAVECPQLTALTLKWCRELSQVVIMQSSKLKKVQKIL